ncbi:MAG: hypothetical protein ACHQ50_10200 [Fimbriimonadales bacterium]
MDVVNSGTRPIRLGAFVDGVGWVEHEYGRVWQREDNRLVAAPDQGQIDLILKLAKEVQGPFQLSYVLLVPRDEGEDEGRFDLAEPLSFDALRVFLRRFRKLFEEDGRHHLTITSTCRASIVYDQHNVLYLSGPLDLFVRVLGEAGLHEGEVRFPSPHSHHYHDELDSMLDDLLEDYEWRCYAPEPVSG